MESIDRFCSTILRTLWRHSPVNATYLGIHDYDSSLSSYGRDVLESQCEELQQHLAAIEARRSALPRPSREENLDLDLLEGELKTILRTHHEIRAPFRNPCCYLEEATFGVYLLMVREHAPAEERARAVAARLAEVPRILSEARRNLDHPEEIPPLWSEMALDLGVATGEFLGEATRWARASAAPLADEVEKREYRAREAVSSYLEFLRVRVQPVARGSFATGREYFEFLLNQGHGISDSAAELESFGREEIRNTQALLRESCAGGAGESWEEMVKQFQRDVPSPQGLLTAYREEIERARAFIRERDLVDLPAADSLEVVETPGFERKTTPFAAYVPPAPFEELQKGYFWVTPPDPSLSEAERQGHLREHMLPSIPITCVHEGYPGHHVQLSLANRVDSPTRRQISTPVLVEGWALYCEAMMGEQGFYTDPRTRLLQLKDYLWRCTRVVIDVGLHTGGLSVDEAVRMLVEVARINPASARGEVKRYSKTPTQPLSYAVGKREILRLRDDLRLREGERFSLSDFHRRLLGYGSIPPKRIREQILPAAQA